MNDALHWLFKSLEGLFFVGLVGCSLVVIISWVSIFRSGFSKEDEKPQKPAPAR